MYIGWLNQANKPAFVPFNSLGSGKGWAAVPSQLTATAFAVLTNNTLAVNVDELTVNALAIAPPLQIS